MNETCERHDHKRAEAGCTCYMGTGAHRWGATCPCTPTLTDDGTGLRHHGLDGAGWTERLPAGVTS